MACMNGTSTEKFAVILPARIDLEKLEKWLKQEIGDDEDPIDVAFVEDEQGNIEWYTYIYHWMWLTEDNLNNMLPCRRVGFAREEDSAHCAMIWGGHMYNTHAPLYQVEVPAEILNQQFPDLDDVRKMHKLFHWCKNNCKDQSFILLKYNEISFRDKDDAALFKLTWC